MDLKRLRLDLLGYEEESVWNEYKQNGEGLPLLAWDGCC